MSELVSLHVGFLLEELLADFARVWAASCLEQVTSEFSSSSTKNSVAVIADDL